MNTIKKSESSNHQYDQLCPVIKLKEKKIPGGDDKPFESKKITSSKNDLHVPRRLFHAIGGLSIAMIYGFFLSHSMAIHILGFFCCIFYIYEQIRINYPEFSAKMHVVNKYFMRAEEQIKESAMVPYLMGILLTLISFPKIVALCAILTLAFADPASAIIGIKFGKKRLYGNKTLEGSLAFFLVGLLTIFSILLLTMPHSIWVIIAVSSLTAFMVASFECLPIKIDDNLTIPIFTAICLLINGLTFGMAFH
jgi:dolichol kinase